MKNHKPNNKHYPLWLAFFAVGVGVAFLPTILRWLGYKSLLSTTARQDENITILFCAAGGALVAWSMYVRLNYQQQPTKLVIATVALLVTYFLAYYTNLFSLFAF